MPENSFGAISHTAVGQNRTKLHEPWPKITERAAKCNPVKKGLFLFSGGDPFFSIMVPRRPVQEEPRLPLPALTAAARTGQGKASGHTAPTHRQPQG